MSSFWYIPILLIHYVYCDTIACDGDTCACSDSVSGGKCTLNCVGQGKCQDSSLQCRKNDPCQINCIGLHACYGAHFDGQDATDLNITCDGNGGGSCQSDNDVNAILLCGDGDCTLFCSNGACHGIIIVAGDADSWECSPISNCKQIGSSEHPGQPSPFIAPTPYPTGSTLSPSKQSPTSPTESNGRTSASPTGSTSGPTDSPSNHPSMLPTITPTADTVNPTLSPSDNPSMTPTETPISDSINPTSSPSNNPTIAPMVRTAAPTVAKQGAVGEETTAANQFGIELEITFKYNTTNISTDEIKLYLKNTANELITDNVDDDCSELDKDDIDIIINNNNEAIIGTTIYVCDQETQKQLAADFEQGSIESDLIQKINEDDNRMNIIDGSTEITANEVDAEEANTNSTDNTSDLLFYALIGGAILGCCVFILCIIIIIQCKKLKREKTVPAPPKPTQLNQVYSDSAQHTSNNKNIGHDTGNNKNIEQYVDIYDGPGYGKQNTLEMDGNGEDGHHHMMAKVDDMVLSDINKEYKTPGPPPRRNTSDEHKKKDENVELEQYEEDNGRGNMIVMPEYDTNDGFMKTRQDGMDEGANVPPPPLPPIDNNNNEYIPGPVPPPVPDGNGKDEESEDSLDQLQHQFLSDEINKAEDEIEIAPKTPNGLNDNEKHILCGSVTNEDYMFKEGVDNDDNMLPPPIPPVPKDVLLDDFEVNATTPFSTPQ